MGTYNCLKTTMPCPRCRLVVEVEVDCYFGYTSEMKHYEVGDTCEWVPRKAVQNGGRPENGDMNGEGYAECPACGKDFFVRVMVRKDVIQGATPDFGKKPYIPE